MTKTQTESSSVLYQWAHSDGPGRCDPGLLQLPPDHTWKEQLTKAQPHDKEEEYKNSRWSLWQ